MVSLFSYNYYQILGVSHQADQATIKRAYQELLERCAAGESDLDILRIKQAYLTLSDQMSRYEYDFWLKQEDPFIDPYRTRKTYKPINIKAAKRIMPVSLLGSVIVVLAILLSIIVVALLVK